MGLSTPDELGGKFLKSGKVKDIYEMEGDTIMFHFTDRVSAYDVVLPSKIPRKGEVLCKFAEYWFNTLGIESHMVKRIGKDVMIVKKLDMVPIESVMRGYLYGSLYERVKKGEVELKIEQVMAKKLPAPLFDPTTKHEIHDSPITESEILRRGWATEEELKWIVDKSTLIYNQMTKKAEETGFILGDLKLEFGRLGNKILLADSIGPDEFRLWPADKYEVGKTQESFDKQPIRDWLAEIGYKDRLQEAFKKGEPTPPPPELPKDLIREITQRYVVSYEKLTGLKL